MIAVLACLALGAVTVDARADQPSTPTSPPATIVKQLAPGVTLTQEVDFSPPLLIDVVSVDLTAPGVSAEVGMAQDHIGGSDPTAGREDVSLYARRHHALVAVNGDFFPYTGDPLGIGIHNGELFSEPWTGNAKGGPREVLGILPGEHRAIIDKLGFRGELTPALAPPSTPPAPAPATPSTQADTTPADDEQMPPAPAAASITVHGVDRVVGKDEVVVITPLYRGAKVNRPGGVDVLLTGVNLPLQANKPMQGVVQSIHVTPDGVDNVPADGVVLAGGPGKGGAALQGALTVGQTVDFEMHVGAVGDSWVDARVADAGDLTSRGGPLDRSADVWSRVQEAVGGGPRLLANGQLAIDAAEDGFDPSFVEFPNPRTAVGLSADGTKMYIVTVDGRQAISRGVSLDDLALTLQRYGAVDAMNLDGGGSTTMAVAGIVVDSPGGAGFERPVADMLTIYSDHPGVDIPNWDAAGRPPVDPPSGARIVAGSGKLIEGQSTRVALKDGGKAVDPSRILWQGPVPAVSAPAPPAIAPSTIIASTPAPAVAEDDSPVGYVDQRGAFTALRAGTGTITGLYEGRLIEGTITIAPKPAPAFDVAAIKGTLNKASGWADNRSILAIRVVLPTGAPVAGAALDIDVTGGTPDSRTVTTDADGAANVGINWTTHAGGLVTVTSASVKPGEPTLLSVTLGQ